MNQTIISDNPYQCKICNVVYKGGNGIVRHIINIHHNELSVIEYYKKYITFEVFKSMCVNKIDIDSVLTKERLTDVCFECKKPNCRFQSFGKGFSIFCSETCSQKNEIQNQIKFMKTKEALFSKYGVENISQHKDTPDKVRQTKLQKYGNEKYNNSGKQIKTIKEMYGNDITSYTQTAEYKIKVKETSLSKYGVDHFTQSKFVKMKQKETNIEKYGVEHTLQAPEVRLKIEETNFKKYGVKYLLSLPNIREKSLKIKKINFIERLNNTNFEHVLIIDSKNNIFSCKICKKTFEQKNVCLTNGNIHYPRCCHCFPIKSGRNSVFQQEFESFLIENKINYEKNNRKILLKNKEIDFLIKTKDFKTIGVELDGLYYHSEINGLKNKNYHLTKTEEAENKNIRLIHLFSNEWDYKKDIVKTKLLHIFNENKNKKIYGRNTKIRLINNEEKNTFLSKNHIQGTERSSNVKLGAFCDDNLIAVMTFCKPRINLGNKKLEENTYELLRYASDINLNCIGVSSKILSHFIKQYKPKKIVTYADRRWSTDINENLYSRIGFNLVSKTKPNYWYLSSKTEYKLKENRFKYRKNTLKDLFLKHNKLDSYNEKESEWVNMQKLKFDRIWDCGNLKYELVL